IVVLAIGSRATTTESSSARMNTVRGRPAGRIWLVMTGPPRRCLDYTRRSGIVQGKDTEKKGGHRKDQPRRHRDIEKVSLCVSVSLCLCGQLSPCPPPPPCPRFRN